MARHLSQAGLVAGAAALLLAGAVFAAAGTGTSVAGVVSDPVGAPVPGAAVTLLSPLGAIAATTRSDAAGAFRFEAVPPGSYVLSSDFPGSATRRLALQVEAGRALDDLAVTIRSLEVIGDCALQVSPSLRRGHPEIPWTELAGLRLRLVHPFFGPDWVLVWDVLVSEIPRIDAPLIKLSSAW